MKTSKFSEAQIAFVLKQAEDGTAIGEVCRKAGISEATFYNWRKKYAGLMPSEMKHLRRLEDENDRLKNLIDEAGQFAAGFLPVIDAIRSTEATTLAAISSAMNDRGIRTARGGRWHVSSVMNLLALAKKQAEPR
jgi:putative transposase